MVPGLERRDGTAHLLDHTSALMPEHGRKWDGKEPVARVHIGLANTARHNAYQDLLWSRLGHLYRVERPVSVTLRHDRGSRLHRSSPFATAFCNIYTLTKSRSSYHLLPCGERGDVCYGVFCTISAHIRVRHVRVYTPCDGPSYGMLFSTTRPISLADFQEDACLPRPRNSHMI